ncbi:YitT family protein [Clostridium sp. P21]|uniref:YitT family protein n=2 Tax=Clostridium muellerianum TaxID=2716538 RepID=A0A7Y0EKY8_9CLOT|nr:YitT family protein [Clostridium muellerianum]
MLEVKKEIVRSNNFNCLWEYFQIVIGCFITAISFNVFLAPNQIVSGGTAGLSIIVKQLYGVEPAITQWATNIPLFFIGLLFLGKKFGVKTAFGSCVLPLLILLTKNMPTVTQNPILSSVYGGVLAGIGLGLVFRSNGSTGGTSIIATLINYYTGFSIGKSQLIIDGLVILSGGLVFNVEKILYALIVNFITGKAIDLIQLGFTSSKLAFVVSDRVEEIRNAVIKDLDRGLTKLSGVGGYTEEEHDVLMVVMQQMEVNKFKVLVKEYDPNAFIIISDTHEVLGMGFDLSKVKQ